MSKILITGGAGFIGSNLCEFFVHKGFDVVCLDNFSTGHIENIQALLAHHKQHFSLIEGDIRDITTCCMAVKGCDYVLHEAALGSVPRSIDDPMATNDVNICGFLNMLKAAHEKNIKRFVYASSSSVYGDNSEVPKIEEHTGKPLSPYALTKYVDELYADVFHKVYGLQFIGLRYFNVFGRRQDPNGPYAAVIPLFIRQFMGHEHPCINGDGTYSRDFTYIDNVLHMNMLAITTSNPNAYNQIFNTACGDSTTILHLAKATRALVARYVPKVSDVQIFFRPPRVGDVAHSLASIDKAKKLLGYRPCVMFDEGLDLTVKWYYDHWCNIEK